MSCKICPATALYEPASNRNYWRAGAIDSTPQFMAPLSTGLDGGWELDVARKWFTYNFLKGPKIYFFFRRL
ncbi:hypothetical protein B5X24_HaOG210064 [Helicoverpa armigera]|nr:hypothetical protein B5X24_HaOG210064 [Helicoverpa armigera]